jgi:hypothetical protein
MIELQYLYDKEWKTISKWTSEKVAWMSLGMDYHNYRTVDQNGKVITDKSIPKT